MINKKKIEEEIVYSVCDIKDATPSEKRALARNEKRRKQIHKEAAERWKKGIFGAKK